MMSAEPAARPTDRDLPEHCGTAGYAEFLAYELAQVAAYLRGQYARGLTLTGPAAPLLMKRLARVHARLERVQRLCQESEFGPGLVYYPGCHVREDG